MTKATDKAVPVNPGQFQSSVQGNSFSNNEHLLFSYREAHAYKEKDTMGGREGHRCTENPLC